MKALRSTLAWMAILVSLSACGTKNAESDTSQDSVVLTVQSAIAAAASPASASEGGSLALAFDPRIDWASGDYVDPVDSVEPQSTSCTYTASRSTCANNTTTVTWNNCSIDRGRFTLSGSWTETFSGTDAAQCTIPVGSGGTVVRTTTGTTLRFPIGATLTTDTLGGSTWDGTTLSGTGITVSNNSGTRQISIEGLRRVLRGPTGRVWFDHLIQTSVPLSVTGSRAGGNRVIASGEIKTFHQTAQFTTTNVFNNVSWGSSLCCYPTSGTITSTFAGSVTGTATLDFSPGASTCGQANYTAPDGQSSEIVLQHCE